MKRHSPQPLADISHSRYLTVAEAAAYLRKTPKAIMRMRERQQIPFIKQGHFIMFDRQALDAWMAGQTQVSVEQALQKPIPAQTSALADEVIERALQRVGTHVGITVGHSR